MRRQNQIDKQLTSASRNEKQAMALITGLGKYGRAIHVPSIYPPTLPMLRPMQMKYKLLRATGREMNVTLRASQLNVAVHTFIAKDNLKLL